AGLSACITAGIGNIASIRQVKLHSVETTIEGDINLNGIFGLDKSVRNGFSGVRATFRIKGDAPDEVLEQIVQQSVARSAVFDVLPNGAPATIAAIAGCRGGGRHIGPPVPLDPMKGPSMRSLFKTQQPKSYGHGFDRAARKADAEASARWW